MYLIYNIYITAIQFYAHIRDLLIKNDQVTDTVYRDIANFADK